MNTILGAHVAGVCCTDISIVTRSVCLGTVIGVIREDTTVGRRFTDVHRRRIVVFAFQIVVAAFALTRRIDNRDPRVTRLGIGITGVGGTQVVIVAVEIKHAAIGDDIGTESALTSNTAVKVTRIIVIALAVADAAQGVDVRGQTRIDGRVADFNRTRIKVVTIDVVVAATLFFRVDALAIPTTAPLSTGVRAGRDDARFFSRKALVAGMVLAEGGTEVITVTIGVVVDRIFMVSSRTPIGRITVIGIGVSELQCCTIFNDHFGAVDGDCIDHISISILKGDGVVDRRAGLQLIGEGDGRAVGVARDETTILGFVSATGENHRRCRVKKQ